MATLKFRLALKTQEGFHLMSILQEREVDSKADMFWKVFEMAGNAKNFKNL